MKTDMEIRTDVLIVGTGPAGASLACFLAYHQVSAIMISAESSTTVEPRAHLINAAAVECLRDIGLEEECRNAAASYSVMPYWRISETIAGVEFYRMKFYEDRKASEWTDAVPCENMDCPQHILEPILIKRATQNGIKVRWDTKFISCVQSQEENDGGTVLSTCIDLQTGNPLTFRSRFLCGADGGRSRVLEQIGTRCIGPAGASTTCYSLLFEADLSHLMSHVPSLLHFLLEPSKVPEPFSLLAICRTVKPWNRFQIVAIPPPGLPQLEDPDAIDWSAWISDRLGDPIIKPKVLLKTKYRINEACAEIFSKGNIFCLGDAVHRHPPHNGLGANTCIQDAYNLAWKLSYVLKSLAPPSLLETYNAERQPVGQYVVKRANDSFRNELCCFGALGLLEPDVEKRRAHLLQLQQPGEEGRKLRAILRETFEGFRGEYAALGGEMNQFYQSSAIYPDDEPEGRDTTPRYNPDKDLHYTQGTTPGMRLPHAWLCTRIPGPLISTQDLAGKGRFTLFTGIGGKESWSHAAAKVVERMKGLKVEVFSIGWCQDYEDRYYQWEDKRGVEEDGAVLVRPDRFVCWRYPKRIDDVQEAADKVERVLRSVLGLSGSQ